MNRCCSEDKRTEYLVAKKMILCIAEGYCHLWDCEPFMEKTCSEVGRKPLRKVQNRFIDEELEGKLCRNVVDYYHTTFRWSYHYHVLCLLCSALLLLDVLTYFQLDILDCTFINTPRAQNIQVL